MSFSSSSTPEEAELSVAEVVGRLMHFWGFKRPMGRVWTILYLSPTPISAACIGERLKMSAGAVSMALNELEKWGAVQRTWIPGERRDYFAAEDDIWKLVKRVMQERELALVRDFSRSLDNAKDALGRAESGHEVAALTNVKNMPTSAIEGDLQSELRYKRQRLERLASLSAAGETLLAMLVEGAAINPAVLLDLNHPPSPNEEDHDRSN